MFQKLESESLKELESLKNNEEWENFTIAFYGETGAGKSTLIECLRMFFKEQSKVVQQERFKRLYSNYQENYQNDGRNKQAILNELHSLQDGAIIGDGRSDFTLKTRSYSFQYNHQNFILLDVPGIEGSEQKVIDQISGAMQKAHAIFYVTKTPNPPQKGEEGKRGTIEKIQRQLDSQTEVWAIFNKPINNPRAFKDGLINESEKESLKILNKEMKNILGKHYMGHQIVSVQMAFYGLASALLPESDFYKNKQKFLKDFKAGELLYQSHFKPLAEFITEVLIKNSHAKIIESNCNKALKVVEELQKAIKTTIEKRIDPMIKEAQEHQQEARFKRNQKRNQEILQKLLDFVHIGEEYGIKVEESLKDKIRNAIKNVAGQKLKVALVGGFSEGKTSIVAAWIDRLDKSMKIDHQESSDEVKIYDIDNEMELVDTPGLFGFKEKITDSGTIERYKDITKKYISETHLILYALNPSNPIKESHKDDLNWLFRTLNLLFRTIFVISRFDEEADIEDEEDYNKRFKIKKENIQNRLNELISLSEEEKESLIIVAVAANPFDLGVEHWLKHQEEFQKLSHIKALQDATQKKIKENGGKLTIIEETKKKRHSRCGL